MLIKNWIFTGSGASGLARFMNYFDKEQHLYL